MDDLSDAQLSEYQEKLTQLAVELQELLDSTESGAQPVKLKDNQGRLTRMDEMHNQSILIANRNVTQNRLKAVHLAQKKMDDGHYGYCETCEEPIAFNRLQAYPDANRCIECQSLSE